MKLGCQSTVRNIKYKVRPKCFCLESEIFLIFLNLTEYQKQLKKTYKRSFYLFSLCLFC